MDWGIKNKFKIIAITLIVLIAIGVYIALPYFQKEPTCFDGVLNGGEAGVDCGGACALVCTDQAKPLAILWSASGEVVPGRYNSVASIQNQNPYAGIAYIPYEFRLYDSSDVLIAKRVGSTFIDANQNTAIFEGAIETGSRIPVRTEFEFKGGAPSWQKIGSRELSNVSIIAKERLLVNADTSPRLEVVLGNGSLRDVAGFDVVVVLLDKEGNLVHTSSTYVDGMRGASTKNIYFTWPQPFTKEVVSIEVFPRMYLFK